MCEFLFVCDSIALRCITFEVQCSSLTKCTVSQWKYSDSINNVSYSASPFQFVNMIYQFIIIHFH